MRFDGQDGVIKMNDLNGVLVRRPCSVWEMRVGVTVTNIIPY